MTRVERREQADEQGEDEDTEEGERDVVAPETAARERPRAFAFDLGAALFRRQLGGGVESEFLLAGGRHKASVRRRAGAAAAIAAAAPTVYLVTSGTSVPCRRTGP